MAAILPDGLIRPPTAGQYAFDDSVSGLTNSRVLHRMWKVQNVQSALSLDNVSARSRNMLWRIWSHPGLTEHITTDWLFRLLQHCERESRLTPTGPLPPWMQRRIAARSPAEPLGHTAITLSAADLQAPTDDLRDHHHIETSLSGFHFPGATGGSPGLPQGRATEQSAGHGRALQDDPSGSNSTATSESGSRPALNRSMSGGRPRNVVANAGRTRARPSLPRRKSSTPKPPATSTQPTSPGTQPEPSRSTLQSRSPPIANALPRHLEGMLPPPGLPLPNVSASASGFQLPSASSWQSEDDAPADNVPQQLSATAPTGPPQELVSRDFRERFVENQKKIASSSNLAGLNRIKKTGSVVRFADETFSDIRGSAKGKERESLLAFDDETTSRASRLRNSQTTEAIEDDSDSDSDSDSDAGPMLPRTRSQLSLMINERRHRPESEEFEPPAQNKGKDPKTKAPEKGQSKEDELLNMGRRDGVTKAGGVQVPKTQRVSEMNKDGRYESPSPPPLF